MPLVFSAGFIWPVEAIPSPIVWLSQLFPSTPAIQAFLTINQMGGEWASVASHYTLLWLQAIAWTGLACFSIRKHLVKKVQAGY
jgi:ABC-2 type transport system permease protein